MTASLVVTYLGLPSSPKATASPATTSAPKEIACFRKIARSSWLEIEGKPG
jgi:hypothetical protein